VTRHRSDVPCHTGIFAVTLLAIEFLDECVLGMVAERFGLAATMWLLLLGPIALLAGLSRHGIPCRRRA